MTPEELTKLQAVADALIDILDGLPADDEDEPADDDFTETQATAALEVLRSLGVTVD